MSETLLMPALSPTMEVGKLGKWFVKVGDTVEAGDLLAEIETDKATMEFEAVDSGKVAELLVTEGAEGIKVNTPIAILVDIDEEYTPGKSDRISNSTDIPKARETDTAPEHPNVQVEEHPKDIPSVAAPSNRIFASPLARRLARERRIDLANIKGSGPHGRIVKADIPEYSTAFVEDGLRVTRSVQATSSFDYNTITKIYANRKSSILELDGMRKTVAMRLTEAKQTIPHFYLRRSIKLDSTLKSRIALNKKYESIGAKLSINDFIIAAVAKALQEVPTANCIWADGRIMQFESSDIAIAVAVKGGLFTPVILDADTKPLTEISSEMKDLALRSRERKLKPHEYAGGSCTISNLGMFGIESFDAVINPPHSSILAIGTGLKQPCITPDGSVSTETSMAVTLSVDHRAIDGAIGAEFLASIVRFIEAPILLM